MKAGMRIYRLVSLFPITTSLVSVCRLPPPLNAAFKLPPVYTTDTHTTPILSRCQIMCVCYLEPLKGIRVETVIIPLSQTCHYCLFSSTACASASTSAQAQTHTCCHTKVFLTVPLFTGKHLLSCATCGIAPKRFHPLALFLTRFSPLLSVPIVIAC